MLGSLRVIQEKKAEAAVSVFMTRFMIYTPVISTIFFLLHESAVLSMGRTTQNCEYQESRCIGAMLEASYHSRGGLATAVEC